MGIFGINTPIFSFDLQSWLRRDLIIFGSVGGIIRKLQCNPFVVVVHTPFPHEGKWSIGEGGYLGLLWNLHGVHTFLLENFKKMQFSSRNVHTAGRSRKQLQVPPSRPSTTFPDKGKAYPRPRQLPKVSIIQHASLATPCISPNFLTMQINSNNASCIPFLSAYMESGFSTSWSHFRLI